MVAQIRKIVTEQTGLSISLIALIVGMFAGMITWTQNIEARVATVEYMGSDLERHRSDDEASAKKLLEAVHSVDNRLSRIEGKLGIRGK